MLRLPPLARPLLVGCSGLLGALLEPTAVLTSAFYVRSGWGADAAQGRPNSTSRILAAPPSQVTTTTIASLATSPPMLT